MKTINYKFNKSSDNRDCIVKSVELDIAEQIIYDVDKLSKNELIELIINNDYFDDEDKESFAQMAESENFDYDDIIEDALNYLPVDLVCHANSIVKYSLEYNYEIGEFELELCENEDFKVTFNAKRYEYRGEITFEGVNNIKAERIVSKNVIERQLMKFTKPNKLKQFIKSIDEPIEFIANSAIDEVLLIELLGEWNYDYDIQQTHYQSIPEKLNIIGSPNLNSNWTFKIIK